MTLPTGSAGDALAGENGRRCAAIVKESAGEPVDVRQLLRGVIKESRALRFAVEGMRERLPNTATREEASTVAPTITARG